MTYFQLSDALRSLPSGGCSAQLDTSVDRIVDVGEDTTRERTRRTGFADHQSALPERGDCALDVLCLEAPMVQSNQAWVLRLLHLEKRVSADLDVRRLPVGVAHHLTESELLLVELQRLGKVLDRNRDVVQAHRRLVGRHLRTVPSESQHPTSNTCDEQNKTPHWRPFHSKQGVIPLGSLGSHTCVSIDVRIVIVYKHQRETDTGSPGQALYSAWK